MQPAGQADRLPPVNGLLRGRQAVSFINVTPQHCVRAGDAITLPLSMRALLAMKRRVWQPCLRSGSILQLLQNAHLQSRTRVVGDASWPLTRGKGRQAACKVTAFTPIPSLWRKKTTHPEVICFFFAGKRASRSVGRWMVHVARQVI